MTMNKLLLFDGFCCAGGAGAGYERAGWHTVGCDIDPKPLRHNPHECYQGDVLAVLDTLLDGGMWHGYRLGDFQAFHCSPPCQDYSPATGWLRPGRTRKQHPRMIEPTRQRLIATDLPWVLENVRMALVDMLNPVMLCGTSLGLRVQRHRIFDSSHLLFAAGPCHHQPYDVSVRRQRCEYLGVRGEAHVMPSGEIRYRNLYCPLPEAKAAMGIDWMNGDELGEAVPPAYTEWLGRQLLTAIGADCEVA